MYVLKARVLRVVYAQYKRRAHTVFLSRAHTHKQRKEIGRVFT